MDSGRLFRAVITFLTLLACLWVLSRLERRDTPHQLSPADSAAVPISEPHEQAQQINAQIPVEISALPLVALDNTCLYDGAQDLSRCTGAISGGPVREYQIQANGSDTYYVAAEPRSEFYDLSLVLFDSARQCMLGRDEQGPGFAEGMVLEKIGAGHYSLLVGGYSEDCGPFELTVSDKTPAIAQIMKSITVPGRNGTVVRWETFGEVDLAHFELYRQNGSERERIAVLRAHGSKAGFAFYRFMDRQPRADSMYVIEAVARDGRREIVKV